MYTSLFRRVAPGAAASRAGAKPPPRRAASEATAAPAPPPPPTTTTSDSLPPRRPRDSFVRMVLPFATDLKLRENHINHFGELRLGLILEELDSVAAQVAYRHAAGFDRRHPLTIVTASVDRMDLLSKTHADRDLLVQASVTYVGTSSMEVLVEAGTVHQWPHRIDPLLVALFMMVARDPATGRAAAVNRLEPETERERGLFRLGEESKQRRVAEAQVSLLKTPPTAEERLLVHNLWLESRQRRADAFAGVNNVAFLENTGMTTTQLMFPQNRNIHGKVFGGFLMRKAFELGFTTAYGWARRRPQLKAIDDIFFIAPVEIGSVVEFSSRVIFQENADIKVRVQADVLDMASGDRKTTNVFYFTFTNCHTSCRLLPRTYGDAMDLLEGMRRYQRARHDESRVRLFHSNIVPLEVDAAGIAVPINMRRGPPLSDLAAKGQA